MWIAKNTTRTETARMSANHTHTEFYQCEGKKVKVKVTCIGSAPTAVRSASAFAFQGLRHCEGVGRSFPRRLTFDQVDTQSTRHSWVGWARLRRNTTTLEISPWPGLEPGSFGVAVQCASHSTTGVTCEGAAIEIHGNSRLLSISGLILM